MTTHLIFVLGFVFGVLISFMLARRFIRSRNIGDLRLDNSDPNSPPYLFLEIRRNKRHLIKAGKYVITRVKIEDYIPRE